MPLCKVRSKVTGVTYERRQVGIRNARRKASWPVMTYKGVTEDVLQWWCFYLTPFLRHQRSWCRTGRGGGCLGEGAKKKRQAARGKVEATFWARLHHSTSTPTSDFLSCFQSHPLLSNLCVGHFFSPTVHTLPPLNFPRMTMALMSVLDQEIFY